MSSTTPQTPRDSIVHIADLHFWQLEWNPLQLMSKRAIGNLNVLLKRRKQFAMEAAEPFVEEVEATGAKEILLTGDFTSTSTHAEFRLARAFVDHLRKKGFNVHLMPGNHDVYTFESVRAGRFAHYFAQYLPPAGFPVRRTLPGGTPLIVVPTVCPNWFTSKGRIRPDEIEKTGDLLSHCGDEAIVVAGHYPLLTRTISYTLTRERRLRNADDLRHTLGRTGKSILYASGHVHRFSYTQDPDYPNLHHLTTGAFFFRNYHENLSGEFARINVFEDTFSVRRFTHTDDWDSTEAAFEPPYV